MSRRTLLYVALAAALVVGGSLLSRRPSPEPPAVEAPASASSEPDLSAPFPIPEAAAPVPLRRPPSAVAEYGVLTSRSEEELNKLLDRSKLAVLVTNDLCGNAPACEAVRATLGDEQKTSLHVFDASVWGLEKANVDASVRGLSPAEKASVAKLPRVVAVRVSTPAGPEQLALRTALATTAAIARAIGGTVWDQLLERIEKAPDFAKHAITTPLDAPSFRRDRVEILYEPKGESVVRVLTSGLSRFGAPDVEAAAVPTAGSAAMAEIVLAVARAIADGRTAGPIMLTREDIAAARGHADPADAGLPALAPVAVDVVMAHPENGDPNDFIARIIPPAGEGPIGYVDLAERFFGPLLAAAPSDDVLKARHAAAQDKLATLLARWDATRASGAKLLVLVPFGIPGDAGTESMWLEVTRYDARSVTGTVKDDPLAATDVTRGESVTKARSQVEDVELREAKP